MFDLNVQNDVCAEFDLYPEFRRVLPIAGFCDITISF